MVALRPRNGPLHNLHLARMQPAIRGNKFSQIAAPRAIGPLVYDLHEPTRPVAAANVSPILFLHGLFGSKKNNRSISKVLARDLGKYVFAMDMRNHGESPHDTRHDYIAMAEDVAGFIKDHEIKDPIIIGHSMGAKIAMTLALRSPSMVSNFVAVDNAPVDATLGNDFLKYVRGMKKIQDANVGRLFDADTLLKSFEESLQIRQFLLTNLHRPSGGGAYKFRIPLDILARSLPNLGDFPFKDPKQRRFEKHCLFIRGIKSPYVADEFLPLIGEFFPRFKLVNIDAGHWLISEQPEAFRRAVVDYLCDD